MTERKVLTCNRCGYLWCSKRIPKNCAKCKSPYYNKDRVKPQKKEPVIVLTEKIEEETKEINEMI